jgi:hypothetical protein
MVTVPAKDASDRRDFTALALAGSQIAGSVVAIVALIISARKK